MAAGRRHKVLLLLLLLPLLLLPLLLLLLPPTPAQVRAAFSNDSIPGVVYFESNRRVTVALHTTTSTSHRPQSPKR